MIKKLTIYTCDKCGCELNPKPRAEGDARQHISVRITTSGSNRRIEKQIDCHLCPTCRKMVEERYIKPLLDSFCIGHKIGKTN